MRDSFEGFWLRSNAGLQEIKRYVHTKSQRNQSKVAYLGVFLSLSGSRSPVEGTLFRFELPGKSLG